MRRLTLQDIILSVVVIALAAFTLVPAIARIQRTGPAEAKCQANLQRLAEAIELYVADNSGFYPTNRYRIPSTGQLTSILPSVNLSPPDPVPPQTEPPLFVYGITWVESLYQYLQSSAEKTGQDRKSFWKCPSAPSKRFPTSTSNNCAVNYVFNRSLVEKPSVFVRNAGKLMMLREFSRLTISVVRPMGDSTGNSAARPFYPFLNKYDGAIVPGDTSKEYNLHGNGSYILFADGHVRHFTVDYYPEYFQITAAKCWDPNAQQWYNYYFANPVTPDEIAKNKSIAITP